MDCSCNSCSIQNIVKKENKININIILLIFGGFLFLIGILLGERESSRYFFVFSYILLSKKVFIKAFKNIVSGKIFDENFLMITASLGAMIIGEFPESAAVMLFYRVGDYFEAKASGSARESIKNLLEIKSEYANVLRNTKYIKVRPEDVMPGEKILIKPGEKIPLDCKIVSGESSLNMSAITGETLPVYVMKDDEIISGGVNNEGTIEAEVLKSYEESAVSVILSLVENAKKRKAKTEKFITKFAGYYTPSVVFLAFFTALVIPLFTDQMYSKWIYRGLIFLVVSCPCALMLSVPLTYFGGIGAALKNGILIKGGNFLEALTKVENVIFDKTGTLTKGKFEVTDIYYEKGFSSSDIIKYAAYADNFSNHPLAKSIVSKYNGEIDITNISSHREYAGYGVIAQIDGKEVIAGNAGMMNKYGIKFNTNSSIGAVVYIAVNGVIAGSIVFEDIIRSESKNAVEKLKKLKVKNIVMLSGDNEETAQYVAGKININIVHSRLLPQDKVKILEKYLTEGKSTIFAGDGINDAPVIARADIGFAMGNFGSHAAIESADVVLMDDNPMKIAKAIEIANMTKKIVRQNIIFVLGIKIAVMALSVMGLTAMYQAIIADVGVAIIAVLNAARILKV